jgi:hypothetical protein
MTDRRSLRPRLAIASRVAAAVAAGSLLTGIRPGPACAALAVAGPVALMGLVRPTRRAPAPAPAPSAITRPRWAGRDAIRARPRRADRP